MILDRLLGKTKRLATKIPGRSISETPGVLLSRRQTAAGVAVDETEALSLSGVFAAVQLLSSIIGALPLSVYRKSANRREVADDLNVQSVLHDEYNPWMTAFIARRTSEFHRLLWGNEYAEIELSPDQDVEALWPIEPWRVQRKQLDNGGLGWIVDGQRLVLDHEMVHVPLISFDGVEGKCFVDFALKSLGLGISMQDFSERFIANDARPGGLLKHAGTPNEKARKEFRDSFMEAHRDPNKVGVMFGGWEYVPGSGTMELEKVQLLESKRFQIEEVARWFNIPPHLLRDLSRATFSNIEHQGIDFVVYSLNPPLVAKEQEYKRKLLKRLGKDLYCKHNVAALMRGDQAARSAFYREMFGIGVFSQNMILELEDQNPIEGGDVHYVPANMMPIEKAIAPTPAPEAEQPKPASDPATEPTDGDAMPSEDSEDAAASGDVQGTALNGAQIASLILVTDKLAAKQYPADSSKAIIQAAFPLMDETLIDRIVNGLKDYESPAPNEPSPPSPALKPILMDVFTRLGKKEANEARRAAKKPEQFLDWLDGFYPKFQATLAQALAPIDDEHADAIAADYCANARETMLDIAGAAKPQELYGLVDLQLEAWARAARPELMTAKALEKINCSTP